MTMSLSILSLLMLRALRTLQSRGMAKKQVLADESSEARVREKQDSTRPPPPTAVGPLTSHQHILSYADFVYILLLAAQKKKKNATCPPKTSATRSSPTSMSLAPPPGVA